MDNNNNILHAIWAIELESLDEIDRICKKYNLRYTLAYGTLLGAVRHGGFIPWDDDLDIMMPRDDYNKLLEIWNKEAGPEYLIQEYHRDVDYTNNFAKVRRNHTTFLQDCEIDKNYHKGIFVDIFPGDYVASGKIKRVMQFVACAVNLLYSRGFTSGDGGIIGLIERILLLLPEKYYSKMRTISERAMCKSNRKGGEYIFFPCSIKGCKEYYPKDMFDNLQTIEFSGKKYSAVRDYDRILRVVYNDYMQLPPEKERVWRHHPIIIDFEHNYEELL